MSKFWRRNGQFHLIVLDKLLQYRLLEPADVIAWVFAPQVEGEKRKTWADLDLWQAVAVVLRTLESRTEAGRGRVEGLKREEETREAEKTPQGDGGDVADGGESPSRISFSLVETRTLPDDFCDLVKQIRRSRTLRSRTQKSRRRSHTSPNSKATRTTCLCVSSRTLSSCCQRTSTETIGRSGGSKAGSENFVVS